MQYLFYLGSFTQIASQRNPPKINILKEKQANSKHIFHPRPHDALHLKLQTI